MARKPNWPPQPHIHAKSGQWRVSWRGKHYYLGIPDSPEAKRAYAELLTRLAVVAESQPAVVEPAKSSNWPTVCQAVAKWLKWAETDYKGQARELKNYRYSVEPLIKLYGALQTSRFRADQLDEVRQEMRRRGLSRAVINRRITRIKTIWRRLERWGSVPDGSWAHLRTLPSLGSLDREYHVLPPVKAAEWRDVAKVCGHLSPVTRAMLLFQWYTGARSGEVRQMRVGEIDRTGDVWIYTPATHKNAWRGQSRQIAIGPKAQAVIEPLLAGKAPTEYVFNSPLGSCYTCEGYAAAVARSAKAVGIRMRPYQARHAAKKRLTRELGLDAARAQLGQKSIETANDYSSEIDLEIAKEAARKLG
jgi:integrase